MEKLALRLFFKTQAIAAAINRIEFSPEKSAFLVKFCLVSAGRRLCFRMVIVSVRAAATKTTVANLNLFFKFC